MKKTEHNSWNLDRLLYIAWVTTLAVGLSGAAWWTWSTTNGFPYAAIAGIACGFIAGAFIIPILIIAGTE